MRKIEELKAALDTKRREAEALLDAGKLSEATAKMEEVKNAKAAVEMQAELDKMEEEAAKNRHNNTQKDKNTTDSIKAMAAAARRNFKAAGMNEGTGENGGYTVPEDIETQIRTLRESADSLSRMVSVENVTTLSGARTYKTRSQQTGMTKVSEGNALTAKDGPTFTRVEYKVEKYGDIFPATNELLEDTDANITGTLVNWIADSSRVGRNKLIIDTIKAEFSSETDLKDVDGIKEAINVTLDPAFRQYIKIITNQDGLQYLDTLKDQDGRYLLTPMVQDKTRYLLFGFELVVLSNSTLASGSSGGTQVPFIIGDLQSAVHLFERKGLSIKASDTAGDAFEKDMTLWRAIERMDCVIVDNKALVRGQITIPAA